MLSGHIGSLTDTSQIGVRHVLAEDAEHTVSWPLSITTGIFGMSTLMRVRQVIPSVGISTSSTTRSSLCFFASL
jgi:hypothetical protein